MAKKAEARLGELKALKEAEAVLRAEREKEAGVVETVRKEVERLRRENRELSAK